MSLGRCVVDLDVGAGGGLDACERRDGVGRGAAVPVPVDGVGERADDGDGFEFGLVEGQRVVRVLEEDDGFEAIVRRRDVVGVAEFQGSGSLSALIFEYGTCAGGSRRPSLRVTSNLRRRRVVELGFGDGAFFDGGVCLVFVGVEELVDAGVEAGDDGGFLVGECVVRGPELADGAAVGGEDVDVPLVDDDGFEDGIDGHGRAVPGVVAGHDAACAAVEEAHAEGDGVVLPEEARVEVGAGAGAVVLVGVGEEVFEEGGGLPVVRVVTLQAVDEGGDHGAVEERVFAVDLFAAAPARVAGEVGLRAPEHEDAAVVFWRLRDVAGFVAFDAGGLLDERGVPGFAHAGRLRELRGGDGVAAAAAALHDAVNALGAAEAGDAEARDGGVGAEAVDLLVEWS